MSPNGITQLSPIAYPTVTVKGEILSVKLSNLAIFLLDGWGVDIDTITPQLRSGKPGRIALSWKLFAAMVAHNYVSRKQQYPSPEEWADRIPLGEAKALFAAIDEALGKVQPLAEAPNQTAAPEAGAELQ